MSITRRMIVVLALLTLFAVPVFASHSWGGYHWARTANPFTLKLHDNLDPIWEPYLSTAVSDWNQSTILDYNVQWQMPLSSQRRCASATGVVEICNEKYGQNGWLGIAGISISGSHITKGYTKLNDTYFNMAQYNTPPWRQMVTCQEIAHDFGLDHQDETFDNANLGSCMDYTNDPDGGAGGAVNNDPSNEHPNQHDYDEISIIYQHLDSTTTIASLSNILSAMARPKTINEIVSDVDDNLGIAVHFDQKGRPNVFVRPIALNSNGELEMEITRVLWALEQPGNSGAARGGE
ncbi:MAG: hypothetical protein AABO58_25015 [Acidobacteriota bacterium]